MSDRFELLERLGRGGMGTVWKARDRVTGDIVALKVIHSIYADEPDYLARFEREVEVAQRIDSPHVVKVLGYGQQNGLPYMAMEYVEGQSLKELIKAKGKLSWEEAKPLLLQVAEGLEAAHRAGVIHRDVKPSNILIANDGTAKLADFGIARAMDLTALTGSSTMLGTPHYMAPDGDSSPQSDLYSLGCVLFEMLVGSPPFTADSHQKVVLKHVRETPELASVPPEARPVLELLLAKEPRLRPASARQLGQTLAAREAPPNEPLAPDRVSLGVERPPRKSRSGFWLLAGSGSIAILVITIVVMVRWAQGSASSTGKPAIFDPFPNAASPSPLFPTATPVPPTSSPLPPTPTPHVSVVTLTVVSSSSFLRDARARYALSSASSSITVLWLPADPGNRDGLDFRTYNPKNAQVLWDAAGCTYPGNCTSLKISAGKTGAAGMVALSKLAADWRNVLGFPVSIDSSEGADVVLSAIN